MKTKIKLTKNIQRNVKLLAMGRINNITCIELSGSSKSSVLVIPLFGGFLDAKIRPL